MNKSNQFPFPFGQWGRFAAGVFLGLFLLMGFAPWVKAQVNFSAPILVSLQPSNALNIQQVNELTTDLESKWAGIYEDYFREDFSSLGLTTEEIGQKLASLQQQTGQKAAIFWINPQEKGVSICLLTGDRPPVGVKVLNTAEQNLLATVQMFSLQVSDPRNQDYRATGKKLYDWLIAPVADELKANAIDTLIFCVGPKLRSLPFAALYDGEQFLAEKYAITRIPGFNLTEWSPTDLSQANILAMGSSEFSDAEPLPGVALEIANITPQPWPGVAMLNQKFTVKNLQAARQEQPFALVHLATHAEFNAGSPADSYIQFVNSRLNLKEIRNLQWQDPPVDLLVLSACTTALGNTQAELGFVGLALQSGVKSALGSLWRVSDLGTMALMSEFYWQLKANSFKAKALQEAQIKMINGEIALNGGQLQVSRGAIAVEDDFLTVGNPELSHPYYWASFSLIGNPF
ncbi:CHAT domain-containing protein [Synechocystis salina]|uniref:CHAT domain-containing protein n=1 Tax=Synechocystis salina TaxID=945780 RepID=UPI002AD55FD7|nr:CHAT domain-containing protein [Synechocystis salina]